MFQSSLPHCHVAHRASERKTRTVLTSRREEQNSRSRLRHPTVCPCVNPCSINIKRTPVVLLVTLRNPLLITRYKHLYLCVSQFHLLTFETARTAGHTVLGSVHPVQARRAVETGAGVFEWRVMDRCSDGCCRSHHLNGWMSRCCS